MSADSMGVYAMIIELDKAAKSSDGFVTTQAFNSPKVAQRALRKLAMGKDWLPRLKTGVDGAMLFARLKEIPREVRLHELLERMLPLIDDENLYDEAMEVLYGNG